MTQVQVGLLVTIEAKPGREVEVERLLSGALPLAQQEPDTAAWYALRLDERRFGIVDFFPDDSGRQAHLRGPIARALEESGELLAKAPTIEPLQVLASK